MHHLHMIRHIMVWITYITHSRWKILFKTQSIWYNKKCLDTGLRGRYSLHGYHAVRARVEPEPARAEARKTTFALYHLCRQIRWIHDKTNYFMRIIMYCYGVKNMQSMNRWMLHDRFSWEFSYRSSHDRYMPWAAVRRREKTTYHSLIHL